MREELARGGCAAWNLPSRREKHARAGAPDPCLGEGVSRGCAGCVALLCKSLPLLRGLIICGEACSPRVAVSRQCFGAAGHGRGLS